MPQSHPSPETIPLRIAVIGVGVFGRNHLRVYRELEKSGEVTLAALVETDATLRDSLAAEFALPVYASVKQMLDAHATQPIQAASVCVPTIHHAAVAEELLTANVDLLIEKPFAANLIEADRLIRLASQRKRILQVGHLERYNPAVTAAAPHLNHPMFFESHRLSVFTPRSLDVDVVLDLMIHDLDIVLSFVSSPVREVRAVGLPVLSCKVDIANVRIEFASGCVANFTASRVSTERVRKLRFFQPRQYVSLDFARQDVLFIDVSGIPEDLTPDQLAALAALPQSPSPGAHPSPGMDLRKLPVTPGEPLLLEIKSFLECVRTRSAPIVSAEDGRAALALALDINRMIDEHARRAGLNRLS
jgi:predicted dehydrogenase